MTHKINFNQNAVEILQTELKTYLQQCKNWRIFDEKMGFPTQQSNSDKDMVVETVEQSLPIQQSNSDENIVVIKEETASAHAFPTGHTVKLDDSSDDPASQFM